MGCGTESAQQNSSQEGTSQLTVAPMSEEEKSFLDKYTALGGTQEDTLRQLMAKARGESSSLALTPQDQYQLDKAYNSGRNQLEVGMRDFADFNAGGRGMRMSDTPVAQQALQRYGLGLAELESQKANTGLNLGFQTSQARDVLGLNAISALPAGWGAAFAPRYNERMATGVTRTTGNGFMQGSKNASIMQQILMGTQAYNQLGQGTNEFASAGMKMGSSDVNLKRDIKPFSWKWNGGDEKEYLGVIAQDVERSYPHLVSRSGDGTLMVNYGAMTAMLLDEREQLYQELDRLREQVAGSPVAG